MILIVKTKSSSCVLVFVLVRVLVCVWWCLSVCVAVLLWCVWCGMGTVSAVWRVFCVVCLCENSTPCLQVAWCPFFSVETNVVLYGGVFICCGCSVLWCGVCSVWHVWGVSARCARRVCRAACVCGVFFKGWCHCVPLFKSVWVVLRCVLVVVLFMLCVCYC